MSLIVSYSLLLDLIDNHKRIHGDTPFPRVPPSSRDQSSFSGHSYGARGGSGPPQNHGSWKRKYSLRHKSPQPPAAPPFMSASSCSLRGASAIATSPSPGGGALPRPRNVTRMTTRGSKASVSQREHGQAEPSSATQMPDSRRVSPAGGADPNPRPRLPPQVSEPEAKRTAGPAVAMAASVAAAPKSSKQPSVSPSGHGGHRQTSKSVSPVSKFVWVKTQNVNGLEPQHSSSVPQTGTDPPAPKPGAEGTVASPVWRKTPGRKPPRRPAQVSVSPKTSKYKWVSSQSKPSRKPLPSKLPPPQKAPETDGKTAKTAATSAAKARREGATSWRSSHYSWRAVAAAGTAAPRRSSFYWTPEKRRVSPGTLPCPPPSSSPGPFKLHSRMKIIRRSANRSVDKNQLQPKVSSHGKQG